MSKHVAKNENFRTDILVEESKGRVSGDQSIKIE